MLAILGVFPSYCSRLLQCLNWNTSLLCTFPIPKIIIFHGSYITETLFLHISNGMRLSFSKASGIWWRINPAWQGGKSGFITVIYGGQCSSILHANWGGLLVNLDDGCHRLAFAMNNTYFTHGISNNGKLHCVHGNISPLIFISM